MTGSSLRLRAIAVSFGCIGAMGSLPAFAEEPVETAIRNWVQTLDASPNWVAGFGELSYDPGRNTATLKNLTIRSETLKTKLEISFGSIAITGYSETSDGGFSATKIQASGNRLVFGDIYDMKLATIDIANLGLPSFASVTFEPTRLFTSAVKAFAVAAKSSADTIRADGIEMDQTYQGQKTHTTIGSYEIAGIGNGQVERVTVGPLVEEMPSPDGLLKVSVDKLEARKYDLNALVDVFDRDRYVGGIGDMRWRTVAALGTYHNLTMEIPGGKFRVGSVEMEELRARQPKINFSGFFDALLANPEMADDELGRLAIENVPYVISAFGLGTFRISDIDVMAPDIDRFHLGDFHINDISSDGLGEIGIADLDVAAQDKGSVGAERLAVGGFTFPPMDRIVAAMKASAAGIESDPLPLIPTMGYAEAINVDVTQGGKTLGAVDRGRLDLSGYIGPIPTSIALDIRGLNLDLTQIDDPQARRMVEGLGYQSIQADYGFKLAWRDADERVALDDFKLNIKDIGSLTGNLTLTGLKRSMIENPRAIETALPSLLFEGGKFVLKDGSIVDRAVAMEAKKKNQTPEKFREDLAGALPFTLMLVLKNPGFQAKLAPALQAFIRTPGTVTITAAPTTPVPLLALIDAAQNAPRTLPDLLSLDVQSSK